MKENDDIAMAPRDYYLVNSQTWKSLVEAFNGSPETALDFAVVLKTLRDSISAGRKGREAAIASLDLGIETAFPLTRDYKAALKLFHVRISGTLKREEELPRLVEEILKRKK